MIRIDHVVVAAGGLDRGQDQLRLAYGLTSYPGGSHPGWGTCNLIVPMADQYLELVAVDNPTLAAGNPLGRAVLAEARLDSLVPLAVCLRTQELTEIASRLLLPVHPGSRLTPAGTSLKWQLVGLEEAFSSRRLPFFIQWEDPSRHPGRSYPGPGPSALGIAKVEVGGDPVLVANWLGAEVPGLVLTGGGPGLGEVSVTLLGGEEITLA